MKTNHENLLSSLLKRINMRLAFETLKAIDAECPCRVGNVPHNAWISEAVTERLAWRSPLLLPQSAGGTNG
jgi:hypothetical protein